MEERAMYVGVDVSKQRLDVAVRPGGQRFSDSNDERAVRRLVSRLKALDCQRIVLEATGGNEAFAGRRLVRGGFAGGGD
jgi:transposase